jgi:hypothetical protein
VMTISSPCSTRSNRAPSRFHIADCRPPTAKSRPKEGDAVAD